MTSEVKIWTPEEDLSNTDLNAEFAHVYATITATKSAASKSVTADLLADGANPEVFFGELFADGRVLGTGLAFLSSSGLIVTLSAGTAYIFQSSTDPDELVRRNVPNVTVHTMAPNTTNFIDLKSDGIFNVNANATPAVDHIRLASVTTDVTSVTANSDVADRVFPENIPLMPFAHANVVVDVVSTTTVTLKSGATFRDNANTKTITTTADLTADITVSGLNGLDQGSESSNTWYAFLEIEDAAGVLAKATLLVAEANYPASIVFPSGYSLQRRVNWVRNDSGSDFLLGIQSGHDFLYFEENTLLTNFSTTTWTDTVTSTFISPSSRLGFFNTSVLDQGDGGQVDADLFWTIAGQTGSSGGIQVLKNTTGTEVFDFGSAVHEFQATVDDTTDRDIAFRFAGSVNVDRAAIIGYRDILAD